MFCLEVGECACEVVNFAKVQRKLDAKCGEGCCLVLFCNAQRVVDVKKHRVFCNVCFNAWLVEFFNEKSLFLECLECVGAFRKFCADKFVDLAFDGGWSCEGECFCGKFAVSRAVIAVFEVVPVRYDEF